MARLMRGGPGMHEERGGNRSLTELQRGSGEVEHPAPTPKPVLSLRDMAFGRNGTSILEIDELEVFPGEIVAMVGPSGCGKTTALMTIAGGLEPIRGEVRIDGLARDSAWRA